MMVLRRLAPRTADAAGRCGRWQVGGEGETYAWGEKWWESVYDSCANLNAIGDQV
jgi:hypothetical protein